MKLDAASFEPRSIDAFLDAQCAVRLCRFDTAPWVFAEARGFVLTYRSPDDKPSASMLEASCRLLCWCSVDASKKKDGEKGAQVFYVCDAAEQGGGGRIAFFF